MKRTIFATLLVLLMATTFAHASTDYSKTRPLESSLVSAFMNLTDLHITSVVSDLDMLAQADQVISGDWKAMEPILAEYQDEHPYLIAVFIKPDGGYWSAEKGRVDKNLSDRDYFKPLMGGEKIFAHPLVSRSTGRKAIFNASPVYNGGKVIGAVGVSIFLEDLSKILKKSMNLPDGMHFYALTHELNTVIHTMPEKIFKNPAKQNEPSMSAAMKIVQKEKNGGVTYKYKGVSRLGLFQLSPLTGWKYFIVIVQP